MLRTAAAALLLLAFAVPAYGATEPAGDYVKRLYRIQISQRYGKVWETLYPAQQRFVTRARFAECERKRRIGFRLTLQKVVVLSTKTEPFRIHGTDLRVTASTVRIRLDVLVNGFLNRETIDTHAIAVRGQWRWAMDRETALAYKAKRCPT